MLNGDMNLSTLIVSHELALVDETFKSLPAPFLSDHEKISSSYVVIEETLNDLKLQPLSASDRIYLDWHLLEKEKCNFQTYSSHQKTLEDMSSLCTCSDWEYYDEGKLVYDLAFSDEALDGLNTEENKEILELLSDDAFDCYLCEFVCLLFILLFICCFIYGELINSNLPLYKYANSSCMPRGEQSHSTSAPVENINYQRSKELLNIFPGEEKNVMRSKEAANEVEARSMPLPNPSMPSAMDAERTQQSMMPFPEMVIIVNSPNLDN